MNTIKKLLKTPYMIYKSIATKRESIEDENYFKRLTNYANERVEEIGNICSHQLQNSSNILYVGCGEGTILKLLKEKYVNLKRLVGIDINESAIFLAKNQFPDMEFYKQDIKKFDTNKFDLIFDYASFMYLKPKELLNVIRNFYTNEHNKYLVMVALPIINFRDKQSILEVFMQNKNLTVWGTYKHNLVDMVSVAQARGGE